MTVTELPGLPRWAVSSLEDGAGMDPLGLSSTTEDRLGPMAAPAVLELANQARYLSFHLWLLREFERVRQPQNMGAQDLWFRQAEWDLGLAVLRCPKKCGKSPIGATRLRKLEPANGTFERGLSVQTRLGGYGLYYRSMLTQLGAVLREGTELDDKAAYPVDVLSASPRANGLVEAFADLVSDTRWVTEGWLSRDDRLPEEVVAELAEVACLCQLPQRPKERDAVMALLFEVDATDGELIAAEMQTRRRAFGQFLTWADGRPGMVASNDTYRQLMPAAAPDPSGPQQLTAALWEGIVAKDVWQGAVSVVWSQWLRLAWQRADAAGRDWLSGSEVDQLLHHMVTDSAPVAATTSTRLLASLLRPIAFDQWQLGDAPVDAWRRWLIDDVDEDRVGWPVGRSVGVLALLHDRYRGRDDDGWVASSRVGSQWQPPLRDVLDDFERHLAEDPTVAASARWIATKFVLPVHERVASSKLPAFTFRWRWEEGRLRFYRQGLGPLGQASIRQKPLSALSLDLGLWKWDGDVPTVTPLGNRFVEDTFR